MAVYLPKYGYANHDLYQAYARDHHTERATKQSIDANDIDREHDKVIWPYEIDDRHAPRAIGYGIAQHDERQRYQEPAKDLHATE